MIQMGIYGLSMALGAAFGVGLPAAAMSLIALTLYGFLLSSIVRLLSLRHGSYVIATAAATAGIGVAALLYQPHWKRALIALGAAAFTLLYKEIADPGWKHTSLRWALILLVVVCVLVSREPHRLSTLLVFGLVLLMMQIQPSHLSVPSKSRGVVSEKERRQKLEQIRALMKRPESRACSTVVDEGRRQKQ